MERNDAKAARARNERFLQRFEAGEAIETLANELGISGKNMRRRLDRAQRARAGTKSYEPMPYLTNHKREKRFDELRQAPYRVLSGIQVRAVVEESGESIEELAARWGVTTTEIKYRAGLV